MYISTHREYIFFLFLKYLFLSQSVGLMLWKAREIDAASNRSANSLIARNSNSNCRDLGGLYYQHLRLLLSRGCAVKMPYDNFETSRVIADESSADRSEVGREIPRFTARSTLSDSAFRRDEHKSILLRSRCTSRFHYRDAIVAEHTLARSLVHLLATRVRWKTRLA